MDIKNSAWWLGVALLLVSYLPLIIGKREAVRRLSDFSFISPKGRWLSYAVAVFSVCFAVVPFFVPVADAAWARVAGASLFTVGAVCVLMSYRDYFSAPRNSPITAGMYRFSRNPIYVSSLLMVLGEAIWLLSPLLCVLLILHILAQHPIILEEERYCLHRYGEPYARYKLQTDRYFFLPNAKHHTP